MAPFRSVVALAAVAALQLAREGTPAQWLIAFGLLAMVALCLWLAR
jgi:hypothetical protein